ncbi:MAG TPA: A24 family peptidase [Catenuloplanes sp.]
MAHLTVACCAVLGAVVGALLPRVAYRLSVPAGAPPRSACDACAGPFPPGGAGWVRLGGRCPACHARLGPRGWLTATATMLGFAALGWAFGPSPVLAPYLAVAGAGVLLAFVDVACLRLPNPVVAATLVAGAVPLTVIAVLAGEPGRIGRASLAALGCFTGYLIIAVLPGANLGFGDVKLAGVLGFLLGWLSWPAVLLGVLIPHLINGPVAVGLLVSRRAGRGTHLPLGPALLAGALIAVVVATRLSPG